MAPVKSENNSQLTAAVTVDPLDIEQYINADSFTANSPSMSPQSSYKTSTAGNTPASGPMSYMNNQPDRTFAGPSHQYEQYRQQASLPVGAIANTFALNDATPYTFGQENYDLIASNSYLGSNIADDYLDLDLGASGEQLDLEGMDFSMDANTFSSGAGVASSTQHIRAWPGMHQQAAMQAKAQAEAQRQAQMKDSKANTGKSEKEDPVVEESISRLLNRMRHSSVSSNPTAEDSAQSSSTAGGHLPRSKKDEEDMDEDERLLASEEGKKLSSKERRQLRNKVSARAFRSRRKEYIGQLEGELAAKGAEADRLRTRNEQLTAENTRLTDLTRMLLSSPHFSTFLDELSANRGAMPSFDQVAPNLNLGGQPQPQVQSQPQVPKDANPHTNNQPDLHIGLATISEDPLENNLPLSSSNAWSNITAFDQRVFALTKFPEEPIVNAQTLSGKDLELTLPGFTSKSQYPSISCADSTESPLSVVSEPVLPAYPADESIELNESDSSYELFSDAPGSREQSSKFEQPSTSPILSMIETTCQQFALVPTSRPLNTLAQTERANAKYSHLRSQLDILTARIESLSGGL